MTVKYQIVRLTDGQKCFGAGLWCVQETKVKIIAAAPTENEAIELARLLAKANNGEVVRL